MLCPPASTHKKDFGGVWKETESLGPERSKETPGATSWKNEGEKRKQFCQHKERKGRPLGGARVITGERPSKPQRDQASYNTGHLTEPRVPKNLSRF